MIATFKSEQKIALMAPTPEENARAVSFYLSQQPSDWLLQR